MVGRDRLKPLDVDSVGFWVPIVLMLVTVMHTCSANADTALLLAQSCAGEAGFDSAETGECDAIMHVYRKRLPHVDVCDSIRCVALRYSAAIKPGVGRRWVRGLNREGKRPDGWPSERAHWPRYRDRWFALVRRADAFIRGEVFDPLPNAEHYGGAMDRGLNPRQWRWIQNHNMRLRNRFYERR